MLTGMIRVLYEDTDVVAADKPAGIASIPESAGDDRCLQARLSIQLDAKLLPVHRLDKEVSGVIIFAKNTQAHAWLNGQFSERLAKKQYLALVHGIVTNDSGTISRKIREFGSGRMGVDEQKGKASRTAFEVVRRYSWCTLMHAFPETGRRHQLRVHFYAIGHPIVGDRRYGDRKIQERYPRLMLHAQSLSIRVPSGKAVSIESPVPDDFSERALHALPS